MKEDWTVEDQLLYHCSPGSIVLLEVNKGILEASFVFRLNSPDGPQWVWRRLGERFAAYNISPRIPFFDGSIEEEFVSMVVRIWFLYYYYFRVMDIRTIDWPPRSTYMNLIEHLWDALKRSVMRNTSAHMNLRELKQVVLVEWEKIPQETIRSLMDSMPRWMEAVITATQLNSNCFDLILP